MAKHLAAHKAVEDPANPLTEVLRFDAVCWCAAKQRYAEHQEQEPYDFYSCHQRDEASQEPCEFYEELVSAQDCVSKY